MDRKRHVTKRKAPVSIFISPATNTVTTIPPSASRKRKNIGASKRRRSAVGKDSVAVAEDLSPCTGGPPVSNHNNNNTIDYSWNSLKLGTSVAGSPALNDFLQRQGAKHRLTARQTLHIVNSLTPTTLLPPDNSPLHDIVYRRFAGEEEAFAGDPLVVLDESTTTPTSTTAAAKAVAPSATTVSASATDLPPPAVDPTNEKLATILETMIHQDSADQAFSQKRLRYHLTVPALQQKFQSLENQITKLKCQEDLVLARGRELGLVDAASTHKILGYGNMT